MFLYLSLKLFLLSLGFLIVFVSRYIFHLLLTRRVLSRIPGPPPSSLLWGEEWNLYQSAPGSPYIEWHKRYGKVVKFSGALWHPVVSITDFKAISFILGEGIYSLPKPRGVRAWFRATLGEGILWVEGKLAHEHQRRILAPALNQQAVRGLTPVFFETSAKLAMQWTKLFDASSVDEMEIDITNWAGRFALDTIGRAAFSYDFDCLSGAPHPLEEALNGLTNCEHKSSSFYMRALFWLFPPVLSMGKKGEMIQKTKYELGVIASRMWWDAKVAGDRDSKTVMAHMLRRDDSFPHSLLDEQHVVSQMRTIISAGYETVSAVVAWILYELASDNQLQVALREEFSSLLDHSMDSVNSRCPLLDAVLKETLRLHPAILENHHETAHDICLPLSEPIPGMNELQLFLPKGTLLVIPVNAIQSDPEIWGPDAKIFRPQRWLEMKQNGNRRGRELLAFSEGPRSCIGKSFAIAEIKALVVTLVRQFSFTCPYEIEAFQSFVVRPRVKNQTASSLPLLVRRL